MKNLLESLKAFYRKQTHSIPGIYRKKGIRPGTDWKVLVGILAICVFVGLCANAFIYFGVHNGLWWDAGGTDAVYQVKINQKLLDGALERFNTQESERKYLETNFSGISDPSL